MQDATSVLVIWLCVLQQQYTHAGIMPTTQIIEKPTMASVMVYPYRKKCIQVDSLGNRSLLMEYLMKIGTTMIARTSSVPNAITSAACSLLLKLLYMGVYPFIILSLNLALSYFALVS